MADHRMVTAFRSVPPRRSDAICSSSALPDLADLVPRTSDHRRVSFVPARMGDLTAPCSSVLAHYGFLVEHRRARLHSSSNRSKVRASLASGKVRIRSRS